MSTIDDLPGDVSPFETEDVPGIDTDDPRVGAWDDPDLDATSSHAEFDGDVGGLDPVTRRAMVLLMKNRFITARSHRAEFEALVKNTHMVRARLNDMYLTLELDHDLQVAYKRQVVSETSERYPTLLYATSWPREETILLVHLRTLVRASRAAGRPRTFVDRAELLDRLAEISTDTDRSDTTRRANRAVEALVSAGVLLGRMDADSFEIDPAVEALLNQRVLEQLLTWIRAHGAPEAAPIGGGPGNGADHDHPSTDNSTDTRAPAWDQEQQR
ncbi:DUF4194 domain-containing protein [Isoptericola sp. NPDC019571]|uniref:DUF4194 domain-containing protein n=1 Tax=Isoptericola sp. NPDC019571 TaxID=3364008 RepID=UPI00379DF120